YDEFVRAVRSYLERAPGLAAHLARVLPAKALEHNPYHQDILEGYLNEIAKSNVQVEKIREELDSARKVIENLEGLLEETRREGAEVRANYESLLAQSARLRQALSRHERIAQGYRELVFRKSEEARAARRDFEAELAEKTKEAEKRARQRYIASLAELASSLTRFREALEDAYNAKLVQERKKYREKHRKRVRKLIKKVREARRTIEQQNEEIVRYQKQLERLSSPRGLEKLARWAARRVWGSSKEDVETSGA
ncbi:hypothetical protein D6817_04750, partial [Candidatus Pacearchaeota archaeon]